MGANSTPIKRRPNVWDTLNVKKNIGWKKAKPFCFWVMLFESFDWCCLFSMFHAPKKLGLVWYGKFLPSPGLQAHQAFFQKNFKKKGHQADL